MRERYENHNLRDNLTKEAGSPGLDDDGSFALQSPVYLTFPDRLTLAGLTALTDENGAYLAHRVGLPVATVLKVRQRLRRDDGRLSPLGSATRIECGGPLATHSWSWRTVHLACERVRTNKW